jgi:autotransporter-associated beta strand protein
MLAVGRGNGNSVTAPTPLNSSLTVSNGVLRTVSLSIGNSGGNVIGYNAEPLVTVENGLVVATYINIAESQGSVATLNLNGGLVESVVLQVGHVDQGGKALINLNGGTLDVSGTLNLGVQSSATGIVTLALKGNTLAVKENITGNDALMELNTSGTLLISNSLVEASVRINNGTLDLEREAEIQGLVQYNAGTLRCSGDALLAGELMLGIADAPIQVPSGVKLNLEGGVSGLGGITLATDGTLEIASASSYAGDTEVSAGILSFRGSGNPGNGDLLMNGGYLALTSEQTLSLGDGSNLLINVEINAGEFRTIQDEGWCDIGTRCPVTWVQNGGLVSLGRPAFGRQNGAGVGRWYGGVDMTINDGTFEARDFFSWKSTDWEFMTNSVMLGTYGTFSGQIGRWSATNTGLSSFLQTSFPRHEHAHDIGEVALAIGGFLFGV